MKPGVMGRGGSICGERGSPPKHSKSWNRRSTPIKLGQRPPTGTRLSAFHAGFLGSALRFRPRVDLGRRGQVCYQPPEGLTLRPVVGRLVSVLVTRAAASCFPRQPHARYQASKTLTLHGMDLRLADCRFGAREDAPALVRVSTDNNIGSSVNRVGDFDGS
jgi:hypothetical protein